MTTEVPSRLPRQPDGTESPRDADERVLGASAARRLEEAYALTGLAWWEWETGTGRLRWSEGMRRLAGLEHLDRAPSIHDWAPLLDPEDQVRSAELEHRALVHGEPYRHVFRIRTPGGETRYLESWTGPLRDAGGTIVGLRGATLDVSERETAQRALAASEEHFRVVFDHAPHGMAMIWLQGPRAGYLLRANDAFARLLGYDTCEELAGKRLADWTPPGEERSAAVRFAAMADGSSPGTSYSRQYLRRDGSLVHAWVTTSVLVDADGQPEMAIAHCIDDTQRRRHERELERMAHTDSLTGLANRTVVDAELARAVALAGTVGAGAAHREQRVSGLLLMDLDRFKTINDSQGHLVGDALLVQVARRLRRVVATGHTVARLGGDEFVVVVHGEDPAEPEHVARTVLEALREPFDLPGGERVVVTTSVGVALPETPGTVAPGTVAPGTVAPGTVAPGTVAPSSGVDDLLTRADVALYAAKDVGRNRVAVYDDTMRQANERKVRAEALLRGALRRGDLHVHLQPVVDLVSGSVTSAEALVRLRDADGAPVPAGELVEVAEESGLVVALDLAVLAQTVRLLAADDARLAAGEAPLLPGRVAVNVSARTIEDPDLVPRVRRLLADAGVQPSRLAVELTETSLLHDSGAVERAVEQLVELGVQVGLDDFGTGYSAMAYLPRFPLSFLKIDMSFVQRLGTTRRADAIVAAIVELAHAHDMSVVAEGVETAGQAAALRAMGCEHGQGWLFGRPAPADTWRDGAPREERTPTA